MSPDAVRFLRTLAPNGSLLTWQTFDDDKKRARQTLKRVLHGPLTKHAATLAKLQKQGAGVFITVNECDGKGRCAENVTNVRALFVDLDGAPLEPVEKGPLAAHIIIESSRGRWHAYWRVKDCALEEFRELQVALAARFNSDPQVQDLPRVMRVPGFLHQKGEPFISKLLQADAGTYTVAEIRQAFQFSKPQPAKPSAAVATVATPADIAALIERLRGALKFLKADDRAKWLEYGWAIGRATGQAPEGFALWLEWAQQSPEHDPAVDPAQMRTEYFETSAKPHPRPVHVGTIFADAYAAGWRPRRACTELGNAERIADAGEGKLKYCPQLDCWLAWDGGRWRMDEDGVALRVAKAVARGIYAEAQVETDDARRAALGKWAVASESAGRLRAAVDLARSDLRLIVNSIELDADPMLLGVRNGVLDLRTGKLLPAAPEQYITRQANVAFDPSAQCPLWEAVIQRIFAGDAELIAYLQRATGYMLTGDVMERLFFFAHGEHTGTGKTTFSSTLLELWGDYAVKAKSEILMRASFVSPGRPQPEILVLRGARLVIATELSDEQRFDEEQLKDLVGGMDTVTARTLHSAKMQAFIPTFKLLMYGNQKPRMRADDDAIWGRLHLIPFIHEVPRAERDKTLPEKLRQEFPGILNWVLVGLAAWRQAGILEAPAGVVEASEGYRSEQDVVRQFIGDCYHVEKDAWAWGGAMYAEYQNWCKGNGFRPVNNNRFAAALRAKGYERREIGGRGQWIGLGSRARQHPEHGWEQRGVATEGGGQ